MFFVALLLLLIRESDCQSNSYSVLTSSTLRSALVSKSGNVIVSDDNTVYLLNGDLSEVIQMDRNEGQSPEGMTLTRDEGRLVVCRANSVASGGQTVNTAPCSIYNSSTLDVLVNVTLPASTGVGAPRGNDTLSAEGSLVAVERRSLSCLDCLTAVLLIVFTIANTVFPTETFKDKRCPTFKIAVRAVEPTTAV